MWLFNATKKNWEIKPLSLFNGLPKDIRGGVTGINNTTYFFKGNNSKSHAYSYF